MNESPANFSRRDFARLLAAGSVALPLNDATADEKEKPKPVEAERPDAKPELDDEREPLTPERLLMLVVAKRFPHEKLTPEILEHIYHDIRNDSRRSRVLSSFPLTNADEPAFHFAAYRSDQAGG